MQIKAYYDKDLLYTNRTIANLEGRDFDTINIVSFNGGNTIDASLVFNLTTKGLPTYIVIVDGSFDGYQYFVTSHKFIKKSQWSLTMIRDILSEKPTWRNMPAMIKTGYEFDKSSGLKYNRYKFNLNTIKTKQELLTNDLSLVMFYNLTENTEGVSQNKKTYTAPTTVDFGTIPTYNSFEEFDLQWNNARTTGMTIEKYNAYMRFNYEVKTIQAYGLFKIDGTFWVEAIRPYQNILIDTRLTNSPSNYGVSRNNENNGGLFVTRAEAGNIYFNNPTRLKDTQGAGYRFNYSAFVNSLTVRNALATQTMARRTDWQTIQNSMVQIGTKYYRVNFTETTTNKSAISGISNQTIMDNLWGLYKEQLGRSPSANHIYNGNPLIYYTESSVKATLTEIVLEQSYTVEVPVATPNMDSVPCKALVIKDLTRENYLSWVIWACNIMQNNKEFMQGILLPFKVEGAQPFTVQKSGTIDDNKISPLIKRDHSYFVDYDWKEDNQFVDKEARFVKIKSASGGTEMDLTPYLNEGIEGFNFNISVKPYGTTIYVQPIYDGLYFNNFDDKRGLVIQEDFSITQINDAWINYKYQNQNYMNSFNRQIESMELNNYYAREGDRLALERADTEAKQLARETTKASMGMFDTLLLGLPSMIGGYSSKVREQYNEAVQLDTEMNETLRRDNINLQKDMFNNNLANIKAIAPTISKVDNFDIMYQYSIIIDHYECTDEEKEYIIRYYQHNGAPIGTIGSFKDYYGLVISGQLIKSTSIYTQAELKEINRRLEGGIYTGQNIDTIYTNKNGIKVDTNITNNITEGDN